jgi:hypothetical protein
MLKLAFVMLCAAALIGAPLAFLRMREPAARQPPPTLPALHGVIGAASLAVLLAALPTARGQAAMGTAGFDRISASLLALALVFGLTIACIVWRGRRPSGALIGVHAGLAIAGLALLLALIALG